MSWDNPALMPLYHVQLETNLRIISYEIATQNFDYVEEAKIHLSHRLIEGRAIFTLEVVALLVMLSKMNLHKS